MAEESEPIPAGTKRKIRGGHRAYARKLVNKAKTSCQQFTEENPCTPESKVGLIALKRTLLEKLRVLEELDAEIIESLEDETDIVSEIEDSSEISNELREAI